MKSNFLLLREIEPIKLFEAIYNAELLFVAEHYHFVPTAIRSFCEGVLLTALNKEPFFKNRSNPVQLVDLISEFRLQFNSPAIISAADRIRKLGNQASHYHLKNWTRNDLLSLFRDAVKLQNFILLDVNRLDIKPVVFSTDSLPLKAFQNNEDDEDITLEEMASQLTLSQNLAKQISVYQSQNRHLHERLNLYAHEESQLSKQLEALNTENQSLHSEIETARQDKADTSELLKQNQTNMETQRRAIELERSIFQQRIALLEKEKQELLVSRKYLQREIDIEKEAQEDQIIDSNMPNLDKLQHEILAISDGKHFLIAPPGAGKTTILTQRLKIGLTDHGDNDILSLTFTTRAAEEMQHRAGKILGNREPFIGTFHSFCLDQIRNGNALAQNYATFSILDDEYRDAIWESVISIHSKLELTEINPDWTSLAENIYIEPKERPIKEIKQIKTNDFKRLFYAAYSYLLILELDIGEHYRQMALTLLRDKIGDLLDVAFYLFQPQKFDVTDLAQKIWMIYSAFRLHKHQSESLDYDDILCLGLAEVVARQQTRAFIQVDEVQDLSPIQWEIIDALWNEKTNLVVVGDPEQSIYGFLGADIVALNERTARFQRHSLIANYRSQPQIVNLLNRYRQYHWNLPPIKTSKSSIDNNSTLLLQYPDNIAELHGNVFMVSEILKDTNRNVGILLATNKACEIYSDLLQRKNMSFFRVGQFDLMQQAVVQDWFSLLRIYQGLGSRKDWWRLVYRFAQHEQKNKETTVAKAMKFVNKLHDLGVCVQDVVSNTVIIRDQGTKQRNSIFNYQARMLVDSFRKQGVVIFDTETTGLDFNKARIIQLAAVKVINGEVVDTFDQYIKLDISSDLELERDFEQSQQVHHISMDKMCSGNQSAVVFSDFFDFLGDCPLMAHNLHFDKTMLRMNLWAESDNYQLLERYHKLQSSLQYDSLQLSRQLYPNLPSYRLADLIVAFNLDGVNSHNALDDVKATASLVTHLINSLEQRLSSIDEILDEYSYLIELFSKHWQQVRWLLQVRVEGSNSTELTDILTDWLEYAKQPGWYNEDALLSTSKDIQIKLIPWLEKNHYQGLYNDLVDESLPKVEKLFTLKESDLIDESVHRIVVSTVHKAKGLQFETVLVPQVTNDAYPTWISPTTPSEVVKKREQEGCRLLYVAFSRPTNKLIVSYHSKYESWEKTLNSFVEPCRDVFSWTNYRKNKTN